MNKTFEIKLERTLKAKNYTEGKLYVNGVFFCHTIEDVVRAKAGFWSKLVKVYAQTAIPYGRYPVLVTWSNRFKRMLTGVFAVPDFEGIRIHSGTSELSSAGCIIVSYKKSITGRLVLDAAAMNDLCNMVTEAQKEMKCYITIVDKV
ncbi:DUF5675 family protein [Ferruginibacter yonginensis]|uniref:DUF5675 family protein n=1 Tax=Ferruginibacter yonginensis TaxID=1310416 RepID=A0ABV8QTX5_9BACT